MKKLTPRQWKKLATAYSYAKGVLKDVSSVPDAELQEAQVFALSAAVGGLEMFLLSQQRMELLTKQS